MKFAFSMLQDFVLTTMSAEEIGDLLTMAGFELEAIQEVEGEKLLDVKVMSNRGDGLSVLGLSREVLAKDPLASPTLLYRRAAERFPLAVNHNPELTTASVEIDTGDCNRYACRLFEGDFQRPTPDWIRQRLKVAGMRSLGLIVDLTNYVMLEVGQPMHAFDLDKLEGHKIVVRSAREGEVLVTLNGDEHKLKPGQMMICDGEKPVGAAGIMGGLDSEVTETTTRILLESAHFVNTSVRKTRKELGLSTEASYRFERSVDPEGVVAALNRFAELMEEIDGGASLVPVLIDVYLVRPELSRFDVRLSRVNELLGMEVLPEEATGYLAKLGFQVEGEGKVFSVTVPSWRPDVVQEYDVVEEVGRVHGFDKIPEAQLKGTTTQGGVFGFDKFIEEMRSSAIRQGFVQNVSSTLMGPHALDDPRGERIGPRNPNSPEMSLLRNSLWPNLVDNARRNGGANLRLFEIGAVFGTPKASTEVRKLAFLSTGGLPAEHWEKNPEPRSTFFAMKSAVEEVLRSRTLKQSWQSSTDPRLHPTRQAEIRSGVLIGQIHPDIAEEMDLPPESFLAEIDLEWVFAHGAQSEKLKPISRNPATRRDIAILIDKAIPYEQLRVAISRASGELLEKQWLFDVYEGKGIPEGKHSLAIALQIRKFGENLTDEEANQVRDRAVAALAELGAIQR